MLGLMKSGELWRNRRGKEYKIYVANWGKFSKTSLDSSQGPFVFGDNDAPFFQVWGGTYHMRVLWSSLKGVRGRGSEWPSCFCSFSNSLSLKYSIHQGVIFGGSMFSIPTPVFVKNKGIHSKRWIFSSVGCNKLLHFLNLNSKCKALFQLYSLHEFNFLKKRLYIHMIKRAKWGLPWWHSG